MKHLTILFLSLFISSLCYAQSQTTDVVYLKNGSIIRGMIIEQVPNKSLKIKTADGSVFVYSISDVEKMTKEESITAKKNFSNNKKSLKGYKGFVDLGYTFSDENEDRVEVSTSHGYQFNNYFFLGGGIAYHDYSDAELYTIPIFANFRANFINNKIAPFGDVRIGYSTGDLDGAYVYMGVGARLALKKKMALNLTLGYSYQDLDDEWYEAETTGFNVKFGFEF